MKNQIIKIVRVLDALVSEDVEYAEKYLPGCLVGYSDCAAYASRENDIGILLKYKSYGERSFKLENEDKWRYIAEISIEPLIGKVFHEPDPILEQFVGCEVEYRYNRNSDWERGILKSVEKRPLYSNPFEIYTGFPDCVAGPMKFCIKIIPETLEEPIVDHEFDEVDETPTMIIDGYKWHKGEKA